jgi:hypothetical protein
MKAAMMRVLTIVRNFIYLTLFYIASAFGLYFFSSLVLSISSPDINIGRISTEFTSNALVGVVFPYSSAASGYFTAVLSDEKAPSIGAVIENPFLYVCIILLVSFGTDGALWAAIWLAVSIGVQIATHLERPAPRKVVKLLESRYFRSSPAAKIPIKPVESKSLRILARVGILLVLLASIAPGGLLVLVITISTLVAGGIAPTRESRELFGLEPTLVASLVAYLIWVLPVAFSTWVVVPPLLYSYRVMARLGKAANPQFADDGKRAMYLRRFDRDRQKQPYVPHDFAGQMLSVIPGLRSIVTFAYQIRLEDSIVHALGESARLIALGDPHERLPMLGAHRVYVGAEDWKDTVRQLTSAADIVILIVDFSTAVEWEIEMVISSDALPRTVLVLPQPKRAKDWYNHWTSLSQKGLRLPEVNDTTAVVVFTSEGEPVRIDAIGHWRYWADATGASLVEGLSASGKSDAVQVNFGPWVRGSTIFRYATIIVGVGLILGYLIPMIGLDVMQYFDVFGLLLNH